MGNFCSSTNLQIEKAHQQREERTNELIMHEKLKNGNREGKAINVSGETLLSSKGLPELVHVELISDQAEPWGIEFEFARCKLDWRVTDVHSQGQADRKGVEVGWYIYDIQVDEEKPLRLFNDTSREIRELLEKGIHCTIGFQPPSFDGVWVSKIGVEHTIRANILRVGRTRKEIEVKARKIKLEMNGEEHTGIMKGHQIIWSDGDVWVREEYAYTAVPRKETKINRNDMNAFIPRQKPGVEENDTSYAPAPPTTKAPVALENLNIEVQNEGEVGETGFDNNKRNDADVMARKSSPSTKRTVFQVSTTTANHSSPSPGENNSYGSRNSSGGSTQSPPDLSRLEEEAKLYYEEHRGYLTRDHDYGNPVLTFLEAHEICQSSSECVGITTNGTRFWVKTEFRSKDIVVIDGWKTWFKPESEIRRRNRRPSNNAGRRFTVKDCERAFDEHSGGSGFLNMRQFVLAITSLPGCEDAADQAKKYFKELDTDQNNLLDKEEFGQFVRIAIRIRDENN